MGKIMWIRCPECGRWIAAEKKNWFGRIERTLGMKDDISEGLGEIGDDIGMKPMFKVIGKPLDWYNKILHSPFEA